MPREVHFTPRDEELPLFDSQGSPNFSLKDPKASSLAHFMAAEAALGSFPEPPDARRYTFTVNPPSNGVPTSHEAAASVVESSESDRARVLEFVRARAETGATSDEIEAALSMRHQNVSARIWQLAGKDRRYPVPPRIVDSGIRRNTRSGRRAIVWVAL